MKIRVMVGVALSAGLLAWTAGCGGGTGQEGFAEVLHGLKLSAASGTSYDAARRVDGMVPAQRNMVRAFCRFAWEIGVNREAWKLDNHDYVINRITTAAYRMGGIESYPSLRAARDELDRLIGPSALSARQLKRYTRACYR